MPQCGSNARPEAPTGDHDRSHTHCRRRSYSATLARGDGQTIWLRRRKRGIRRSGAHASRGERSAADQSFDPRPRHARSRRHGGAGADAPARYRRARDRPDRAWLDRSRHLRHARGRDRLRRQAGRRRTSSSLDPQCAARRCAGGRTAARHAAQRGRTHLSATSSPARNRWRAPFASPSAPPSRTFRC